MNLDRTLPERTSDPRLPVPGGYRPNGPVAPLISWDADKSAGGELSAVIWRALGSATTEAATTWERAGTESATHEEVCTHLGLLGDLVRQACLGEELRIRAFPPAMPSRRLMDAMRRGFLGEMAERTDTKALEIVRVLRSMEQVQSALDRDTAQRFVNRLSGADALDLIVEVAHDMRSPLGSILFLVETLKKGHSGPVTPVQERQLGLVYSAAFGLSSLSSDVIELAKGGDRLVDLHPSAFSLNEIMFSVRDIVQPIAEEKGLIVRMQTPESDFRVGHPAALNRVLLNLTTNALKFTNDGFVEVIGRPSSRTKIEFSVRDTGRGIPPGVIDTLFDAFRRRAKPGEYTFSSAGLGLSICKKLVAAMGGELAVDTALNEGTRFHFELDLPLASKM